MLNIRLLNKETLSQHVLNLIGWCCCLCAWGLWADPCESTLWLLYVQHVLTSHLSAGEGSVTLERAHLGAHYQWTVLPLELSRWRRPSMSRIPRFKSNRQPVACCSQNKYAVHTGVLPKVVYFQTFSVIGKAAMTMFVLGARFGLQTANTCREILSRNKF